MKSLKGLFPFPSPRRSTRRANCLRLKYRFLDDSSSPESDSQVVYQTPNERRTPRENRTSTAPAPRLRSNWFASDRWQENYTPVAFIYFFLFLSHLSPIKIFIRYKFTWGTAGCSNLHSKVKGKKKSGRKLGVHSALECMVDDQCSNSHSFFCIVFKSLLLFYYLCPKVFAFKFFTNLALKHVVSRFMYC